MGLGEQRVRIVAGRWRGRRLTAPKGEGTRPTSDRVREALFSALSSRMGADLGGVDVLDAFAGTGALGLEALSRGAATVVFSESERPALDALRANIGSLGAGHEARVVVGDAFRLARSGGLGTSPFGLLLLDPPYRIGAADVARLLGDLAATGLVVIGATVVWEHASSTDPEWPEGFEPGTSKTYGTTAVGIATYRGGTGKA